MEKTIWGIQNFSKRDEIGGNDQLGLSGKGYHEGREKALHDERESESSTLLMNDLQLPGKARRNDWDSDCCSMVRAIRRHSCPSSCCRTIFSFLFCIVCRPFSIWRLSTRDASSRGVEIAGVFCRRVDETPRGEVGFHRSKSLHTTLYVKDVLLPHFALLSRGGVRQHHRRKGWSLHRPTDGDVEFLGHSKGHGRDRNVCQRKVQQHALVHY